jgi:hypothetical protein
MTNKELLKKAGFKEDNDCLVMDFSDGFSVKAFINNEDDVVFNLYKDGQLFQATIQTSDPDDIANAFKELIGLLPVLLNIINKKSPDSVNDFKQIIQLLQMFIKFH